MIIHHISTRPAKQAACKTAYLDDLVDVHRLLDLFHDLLNDNTIHRDFDNALDDPVHRHLHDLLNDTIHGHLQK